MVRRLLTRRTLGMIFLLVAPMAFLALAPQSAAPPRSNLARGNAPGEWRYWGADAWSTSYSPLDQINASNFASLQVAWQWDAGAFGEDEYLRTTPLYANGRLFTVATTRAPRRRSIRPPARRSGCGLEEGIRWQKAPRQFAGRGPAYWTDGKQRTRRSS